jgi:hypothetical protein
LEPGEVPPVPDASAGDEFETGVSRGEAPAKGFRAGAATDADLRQVQNDQPSHPGADRPCGDREGVRRLPAGAIAERHLPFEIEGEYRPFVADALADLCERVRPGYRFQADHDPLHPGRDQRPRIGRAAHAGIDPEAEAVGPQFPIG